MRKYNKTQQYTTQHNTIQQNYTNQKNKTLTNIKKNFPTKITTNRLRFIFLTLGVPVIVEFSFFFEHPKKSTIYRMRSTTYQIKHIQFKPKPKKKKIKTDICIRRRMMGRVRKRKSTCIPFSKNRDQLKHISHENSNSCRIFGWFVDGPCRAIRCVPIPFLN